MSKLGKKEIAGLIVLAVIALAVWFFNYSPYAGESFTSDIRSGRVEITRADVDKYFVYVSPKEARQLLADARSQGKFVFLFPQIGLGDFDKLIIQEHEITTSKGTKLTLLGIESLPPGSVIYSNLEGKMHASTIEYNDPDKHDLAIFTGETDNMQSEFYVPCVPGENSVPEELKGNEEVTFGTPLIGLAGGAYLQNEIFPENWQMALVVQGYMNANKDNPIEGGLKNVLTKDGRIVMLNLDK